RHDDHRGAEDDEHAQQDRHEFQDLQRRHGRGNSLLSPRRPIRGIGWVMSDNSPAIPDEFRVVAGPDAAGQRVDRFLADAIGTLSRSRIKSLIVEGRASRDLVPLREPAEPVRAGACYTLRPPAPTPAVPIAQSIPFAILFEDADLIVLDKPAGLVVHPAPGNEDGTLVNALLAH